MRKAIGLIPFALARRKAADSVVCDKGIASAISEEQNAVDAALQPAKETKLSQ